MQGFVFLSEDAILFLNNRDSRLELLTLNNHDIILLTCRPEPNPTGFPSKTKSKPKPKLKPTQVRDSAMKPFTANPADAIAVFNLLIMNRDIW